MKAVVQDIFPDQSGGKPLIEQMMEKGKQWWLLDKFLPAYTGFNKNRLYATATGMV